MEILVRIMTAVGKNGFFRFIPPTGTMLVSGDVVTFKFSDHRGVPGRPILGRLRSPHTVEISSIDDNALMCFSDYAIRAGGQMIPYYSALYPKEVENWNRS